MTVTIVLVLQMAILAENCGVTMDLVLQTLAEKFFATVYKRYEINSVNKAYF